MVVVTEYKNGVVYFYCEECDSKGEYDVKSLVKGENCVVDIDVICALCGNSTVLYMLKCTDPALAKELNAKLEVLKIRRSARKKG